MPSLCEYNIVIIDLSQSNWLQSPGTMSNLVQCNICQKYFASQHGLLIHLRYCRDNYARLRDDANHIPSEHNPIKSCYDKDDHLNPLNVYDNLDDNITDDDQEFDYQNNHDGVLLDCFSKVDDINMHDTNLMMMLFAMTMRNSVLLQ